MLTASYAKINLHLEVCGKLPDNYHQVNTVLCSIDLCDFIRYEPLPKPEISLSCNVCELNGTANLVYKVASYLLHRYLPSQGVSIHLQKNIPIAAGLGGGSSNAANCILALNRLWNLGLSSGDMHAIAADFGSDLNFFLDGGTALGQNRGEQISPLPDISLENILLVNPAIPISSTEAYRRVVIPSKEEQSSFNANNLYESCYNRLENGIRKAYPVIDSIITQLKNQGATAALLSGSGSTCFGLFAEAQTLQACQQYFADKGFWVYKAKAVSRSDYCIYL